MKNLIITLFAITVLSACIPDERVYLSSQHWIADNGKGLKHQECVINANTIKGFVTRETVCRDISPQTYEALKSQHMEKLIRK